MAEKLNVELRQEFGKGAARRIRAGGKVPAVLYEHGNDPVHLELPGHDIALAARNPNALLSLKISDGTEHLALIKDIQRHPLKRTLTHLDLIIVRKGEKVEVDIPVIVEGEPVAPAVAFVDLQELTLLVDALNVPEQIEIDVDETEDGYQLFAGDVTLPEGTELVTDPEILVASVAVPRIEEEPEDEEDEGEDVSAEEPEEAPSEEE
ncbi:MAG TPA: 50S ribosomal protein L25/general stress protein Ctc [Candidatus Brachybacterium merdavium]|uniref:Large ribosomal subunit protein bL25 n=1 Tax=Candidatus Brachybacterium merdavium TaxID=2838513 RepID=A0A9D2RQP0_9MICO|nr:50S ribosomal protein L25/general stress protein Ctc [Candidatus Brachybacterium merdavium]